MMPGDKDEDALSKKSKKKKGKKKKKKAAMLAAIGEDLLDSPVQSAGNDDHILSADDPKVVNSGVDSNKDEATKSQQPDNNSERPMDEDNFVGAIDVPATEVEGNGAVTGVAALEPEDNNNSRVDKGDQSDADDGAFF